MFLWCVNAAPDATVISIDLPNGIHGGGYPYWKTFLYRSFALRQQQVLLFRGDSHSAEMLARLKETLAGRQIDFLFIDLFIIVCSLLFMILPLKGPKSHFFS